MPKYEIVLYLGDSDHGQISDINIEGLSDSLARNTAIARLDLASDNSSLTITTRNVRLGVRNALVQMSEGIPAVIRVESQTLKMAPRNRKRGRSR